MIDSTHSERRTFSGLGRRIDAFIVALVTLAYVLTALVAYFEFSSGFAVDDISLFVLAGVLLVVTETKATSIVQHLTSGAVTPSWAFTFTLVLLGSPTGAIAIMAVATVIADALSGRPAFKIAFNVAQISISLALGALVLVAFGIHGPVFTEVSLPTSSALAIILSGIVVFGTNGVIFCRLLAWIEHSRFIDVMRGTFLLTMTSDAAMLAIAPVFLITAKYNLLMLPLMGTATFFVYQTAQNSLRRTHEANHDPLTQLLNRRAFNTAIDEFLASTAGTSATGSLLLLDLDRFKEVNDRLGHRTGDHVLQQFANRLERELPLDATVARLGGDEFAVLLTGVTPEQAVALARSAHHQLAAPLKVDGFPITAGTSIGVAHFPCHGRTQSELLHAADVAMYRAKRFRSGIEVYEQFGATQDRGRITLLADVPGALARDEFFLEYQPQVDMATGRIVSVEALLRWEHPVHGRIAPGDFVSLAEHTDLIAPITQLVMERSIRDIAAIDGCGLAVNVSARSLENRHFATDLLRVLTQADFDPDRLEIEITESALSTEPERTSVVLDELRSFGIRISIDDFGTGYSSFATLRDTEVDRIKIDRSLVRNAAKTATDSRIIAAMIDLAHALELDVVAEGVETVEVWDALSLLGCDVAQGFLMSKPVSCDDLPALIATSFVGLVPDTADLVCDEASAIHARIPLRTSS